MMRCKALGYMPGIGFVECVGLFGGFQGLSADEQVESSQIDNSLILLVN